MCVDCCQQGSVNPICVISSHLAIVKSAQSTVKKIVLDCKPSGLLVRPEPLDQKGESARRRSRRQTLWAAHTLKGSTLPGIAGTSSALIACVVVPTRVVGRVLFDFRLRRVDTDQNHAIQSRSACSQGCAAGVDGDTGVVVITPMPGRPARRQGNRHASPCVQRGAVAVTALTESLFWFSGGRGPFECHSWIANVRSHRRVTAAGWCHPRRCWST